MLLLKFNLFLNKYLARKAYKIRLKIREEAVRTIQRVWKRYRMLTMIPKVMKERKKRAIIIVQKFIRGYCNFLHYKQELDQFRLRCNFQFFTQIRENLLIDSQIKIRYSWRKYYKKKSEMKKKIIKKPTTTQKVDTKYKSYKRPSIDKKSPTNHKTSGAKKAGKSPKKGKKYKDISQKSSADSPAALNADIKFETREKKPTSKFQTSKVVDKSTHKIPKLENKANDKIKKKTHNLTLVKLKSTQEVDNEDIEIKPVKKRSNSVLYHSKNNIFDSTKNMKANNKKVNSSKEIINVKQVAEENEEEFSASDESKQNKLEDNSNINFTMLGKLERLPSLNEVVGDDENSISME